MSYHFIVGTEQISGQASGIAAAFITVVVVVVVVAIGIFYWRRRQRRLSPREWYIKYTIDLLHSTIVGMYIEL